MDLPFPPAAYVQTATQSSETEMYTYSLTESKEFRLPAEFEEQEAIWLAWSWDSAKNDCPYHTVILDIIKFLANKVNIVILYNKNDSIQKIQALIKKDVNDLTRIYFLPIATSTIWLRDTGPVFIKTKQNEKVLAEFQFNEWGYAEQQQSVSEEDDADYKIPINISKALNLPIYKSSIISEGGNRETNGKGTLIVVEEVELSRNPQLSREEIEEQYKQYLGIKKVIWLPKGLYEDNPTTTGLLNDKNNNPTLFTTFNPGGHIDEFCRFADSQTILLAYVPETDLEHPIAKENAKRLEECRKILIKETDEEGNPLKVILVPTPRVITDSFTRKDPFFDFFSSYHFPPTPAFPMGQFPPQEEYCAVIARSYLNFLKCNKTILIPAYWKEGLSDEEFQRDKQVYDIFRKIYPDHQIIQINPYNANLAGGGIHCMTLNQPR